MIPEESSRPRRLVIAAPVVVLSVVVAALLGVLGGRLVAGADGPTVVSIGIAVWWVGLNVLVVGVLSGSAWRRRRPVAGAERVVPGTVARPHPLAGRLHGVALQPPGGIRPRELHGFVSLRAADAERLASRLNELLREVPGQGPGAEGPVTWAEGPVTVAAPPDADERVAAATSSAPARDAETLRLRRALPLVSPDPESDAPEPVDDGVLAGTPRHGGDEAAESDRAAVTPRRARRD